MAKAAMNTILLTPRKSQAKWFRSLHPKAASTNKEIREFLQEVDKETLWISDDKQKTTQLLMTVSWPTKCLGRAVLLFQPNLNAITALRKCFDPLVFRTNGGFLSVEELGEVLSDQNRRDLFIGGSVDSDSKTITLWRGDLDSIVVPFVAFPTSGDGHTPDFNKLSITDFGQTIRLGKYEAAADGILYEFDSDYRRRSKKNRIVSEQSLGASIRRLRTMRGVKRDEFAPLSEKTLARIEQGLVSQVRERTLAIIAKVLGVEVDELSTY